MDLDFYQTEAMSYRLDSANEAYALFNLAAEVGEVLGLVAKLIRDGAGEKNMEEMMKKELGDVMWMVCAVADDAGLSLSEICAANLEKLADRKARNKIMGSGDER
jgi:NTP pyrophosphatase (non-canonical NTP hydrolase)